MKEIAKKAGVSQATVSRVISGNNSVSPEIKMRVMEWVRKLDYQPNIIAQSLVSNKSLLIGVIISDISNPFFSDIIKAIEDEAAKYGYSIILCNTDSNCEKEKKYINILKSYSVDGILIVPSDNKNKYFKSLAAIGIPVVVITQDVPGFSSISISHYSAGKDIAKHLVGMGYSKLIFVGPEGDEKENGFKDGIENLGIDISRNYFVVNKGRHNRIKNDLEKIITNNSEKQGIGIFAYNDIEALITLHVLKELNVKVPENAALVGFDNTFISKEVSPNLSTVAQPVEQIGRQAVEILMDKISGKQGQEEKHIVLEARLVVRESSVKTIEY